MESDTITRRVYVSQRAGTNATDGDERLYFELAQEHEGVLVVSEDGDGKQNFYGEFDQDQLRRALADATYAEQADG